MPRLSRSYQAVLRTVLDSQKLASVSDGAELLYYKLLVASDDKGRFHGTPFQVMAKVLTKKAEAGAVDVATVGGWLNELERANLLRRYEIDGEIFLELADYYDPTEAKRLKVVFPSPPPPNAVPDTAPSDTTPGGQVGDKLGTDRGQDGPLPPTPTPTPHPTPVDARARARGDGEAAPEPPEPNPAGGVAARPRGAGGSLDPPPPPEIADRPAKIRKAYADARSLIDPLRVEREITPAAWEVLHGWIVARCEACTAPSALKLHTSRRGFLSLGKRVDADLPKAREALRLLIDKPWERLSNALDVLDKRGDETHHGRNGTSVIGTPNAPGSGFNLAAGFALHQQRMAAKAKEQRNAIGS